MTRIATGLVLILIGGFVLVYGGLPLALFLMVVGCLAFYEVQQMTELKSRWLMAFNMVVYSACIFFIWGANMGNNWLKNLIQQQLPFLTLNNKIVAWVIFGIIGGAFVVFITEFVRKALLFRSNLVLNNIKFFLYISLGFLTILWIRSTGSLNLIYAELFLFMSIWSTDVFAYFGGKQFGRRPLSPISPKKTIEGTVIGIASAMCFAFISASFLSDMSLVNCLVWGLMACVIGAIAQWGDLYESLIKRTYNVKDSSNLLPGHGGVLDRADSTLFVAPMFQMVYIAVSYL
jgi:phosphatidate cytidylyltransferase